MLRSLKNNWFSLIMALGVFALLGQQYFLANYSSRAQHNTHLAYVRRVLPDTWEYLADETNNTVVLRESKKWIVLDGLASGCDDVSGFAYNVDWMVVVVTEVKKAINNCRSPGCIQLTWDMCQRDLGRFATISALSEPSIMCGYLMAMVSGAEVILESTCDLPLTDADNTFRLRDESHHGLWYNQTTTFNPFEHWGIPNALPRDVHALSHEGGVEDFIPSNSEFMYVSDLPSPTVRQGVAASINTCIQRADAAQLRGISAIPVRSPVAVAPSTLASMQAGPTLFTQSSLPFMFLPVISESEQRGMFRTLWIHLLKKCNFLSLAYYKVDHMSHTGCKSSNGSQNYMDSHIMSCVDSVQCKPGDSNNECLKATAVGVLWCLNMKDESQFLEAWLQDMASLGVQPRMERTDLHLENIFKISYNYNKEAIMLLNYTAATQVSERISETFSSICPRKYASLKMWEPVITDILLIVVINYESLYDTVPFMEYIHRQYFKYILYCGPSADSFAQYARRAGLSHVTFIAGMTHSWYFMYECVTHAMKLRLPVKGYLQMGEDVLLNTWKLAELPGDQMWIPAGFTKKHMYKMDKTVSWFHWNSELGQRGVINAFAELKNASSSFAPAGTRAASPADSFSFFAKRFLDTYKSNLGLNYILHRATDIFYIPEVLRNDYIMASELFRRHKTMIEIALPVIHLGLSKRENVRYINGASLWADARLKPWTHYNDSNLYFIHPFKLRLITKTGDGKKFTCDTYFSKYLNRANALRQKTS